MHLNFFYTCNKYNVDTMYEYLMAKDDPPICQSYSTTLTIKHILEEC